MYSDLFDQLGRGAGGRRSAAAAAVEPPEEPPLVTLKAGQMQLVPSSNNSNSSSNNNSSSYQCTADPSRGEIRLVWHAASQELQWQWYDRRHKVVRERIPILPNHSNRNNNGTFARVPLADKIHALDRVYVWSSSNNDATAPEHRMYWMQEDVAQPGDEEELLVQKINEYLQDPTKAAPEGSSLLPANSTSAITSNNGTSTSSTSTSHQVDALSSILENLGMPQSSSAPVERATTSTTAPGTTSTTTTTTSGALTLADLQGAMAGIAATTPVVPLHDLWTSPALDALLSHHPDVAPRLLPFLPEAQQTVEHLRDNLQSPQVRHALQALQQALVVPDGDDNNYSGYASVLANFQLDPADGQALLAQGNPLAAFLECVVASVEQEKKQEQQDNSSSGNGADAHEANAEEKEGDKEETKDREAEAE